MTPWQTWRTRAQKRERERDRNDEDEGGSWGGLTVIYVAVGSLASCLIKVVSLDRGRAAKLLTRKFSRQSPCLLLRSTSVFAPFLAISEGPVVGALSAQANNPGTKTAEVFETRYRTDKFTRSPKSDPRRERLKMSRQKVLNWCKLEQTIVRNSLTARCDNGHHLVIIFRLTLY